MSLGPLITGLLVALKRVFFAMASSNESIRFSGLLEPGSLPFLFDVAVSIGPCGCELLVVSSFDPFVACSYCRDFSVVWAWPILGTTTFRGPLSSFYFFDCIELYLMATVGEL